jgi:hypothetical protein
VASNPNMNDGTDGQSSTGTGTTGTILVVVSRHVPLLGCAMAPPPHLTSDNDGY